MTLTSVAALGWIAPWVATGVVGAEVERRAAHGRTLLGSADLVEAARVRQRLRAQVREAFVDVDVLVSPTMPTAAPLLAGEIDAADLADPMSAPYTDCWTVVANLTGLPALSVPAPTPSLPVGAMLMGRPGRDADLLTLADAVRRST